MSLPGDNTASFPNSLESSKTLIQCNLCSKPRYFKNQHGLKIHIDKVGEGDIRGAARLLFSTDCVAPNNQETLSALRAKLPNSNQNLPNLPDASIIPIATNTDAVLRALMSFQSGSAGGLDGLTPQHLKDLLGHSSGDSGMLLLKALTDLNNFMLSGKVNAQVTSTLYGANLCALVKKDGGIRPIAVGTTYRRLVAKIGCTTISGPLSQYFQPTQLGFGPAAAEDLVRGSPWFNVTLSDVISNFPTSNALAKRIQRRSSQHGGREN
ncbi:hypothetical protein ACJJTC_015669 [Scirpophaga incertulas]